jgi:ribonucleoside-diphosphate reductase alpha chain
VIVSKKKMLHDCGSIALCTLGAQNLGHLTDLGPKDVAHIERCTRLFVRSKDALLSYQDYALEEARLGVEDYRPLGFGVIGYAHWLAKLKLRWGTQESLDMTNKLFELISFNLIKASMELAKEIGPCKERTRYHDGWLPFDDSPLTLPKTLNWEWLRGELRKYGIRNATLMALMPSETSSQLANETNGVEPPKKLVTQKDSKDGTLPQLVPDFAKLKNHYETLWNVRASDYIMNLSVMQHYMDQAISANTSYDPAKLPKDPDSGKVLMSTFASDFVLAYNRGLKTLYYLNINDQSKIEEDDGCESGACAI